MDSCGNIHMAADPQNPNHNYCRHAQTIINVFHLSHSDIERLCANTQSETLHQDTALERLRRWTRNPCGSARRGVESPRRRFWLSLLLLLSLALSLSLPQPLSPCIFLASASSGDPFCVRQHMCQRHESGKSRILRNH